MCTDPITDDGKTFACRKCNDCIGARKNDWVARSMAELATSGSAMVITLTYRDIDGRPPDGARSFRYADVQKFIDRVRAAYKRKYKRGGEVRYIVCGERGSKRGRVHWHLILFAQEDLSNLGKWYDFWFRLIGKPRPKRMDHWSLWPHGHVVYDEATQESLGYTLKYALKDQFNVERARGTAREARSENSGASYFRMSKEPPIGSGFLDQRIASWRQRGVVPPSLNLKVPGYSGYWYVKGPMRERLCYALHDINAARVAKTGRDCAAWSTLTSQFELKFPHIDKEWEWLTYGAQEEDEPEFDDWWWQRHLNTPEARIRRTCGGSSPCARCWRGQTAESKSAFAAWRAEEVCRYVTDTDAPETLGFDEWFRRAGRPNPFCGLSETDEVRHAFRRSTP